MDNTESILRSPISASDFWYQVNGAFGNAGGIYRVSCARDASSDRPMPVDRLLGTDPEGTLYIGMAACFLDRVIELKKSLSPEHTSKGHECGSRHKSHAAIADRFPYQRLIVTLQRSSTPRESEQQALRTYYEAFGELPPFNRAA